MSAVDALSDEEILNLTAGAFARGGTVCRDLGLDNTPGNKYELERRWQALSNKQRVLSSAAALTAAQWHAAEEKRSRPDITSLGGSPLAVLDDDALLSVMAHLDCKAVRGRLTGVCKRLNTLASSSAAIRWRVDVGFLGGSKQKAITPILQALARLNTDRGVREVRFGNHNWGSTTTKQLTSLFPALEVVSLGAAKKVAHHHSLADWHVAKVPNLRGFAWNWAFDVSMPMVCSLVRGRAPLEMLDLSRLEPMGTCPEAEGIRDELLEELGRGCPALKILRLQGDLRFTDRGIVALLSGCPQLKILSLSTSCIFQSRWAKLSLSDAGISALTAAGFQVTGVMLGAPSYSRVTVSTPDRDAKLDHEILFPRRA